MPLTGYNAYFLLRNSTNFNTAILLNFFTSSTLSIQGNKDCADIDTNGKLDKVDYVLLKAKVPSTG